MEGRTGPAGPRRRSPLIERPGSPRPGGEDDASQRVFPLRLGERGDPRAFVTWLLGLGTRGADGFFERGSPQDALESLLDAGCPRTPLQRLLLMLYRVQVSPRLTRTTVGDVQRTLIAASRGLGVIDGSAIANLRRLRVPKGLRLRLVDVALQLSGFLSEFDEGDKLANLDKIIVRAHLTALVQQTTRKPRDRELGCLVVFVLGGRIDGAAEAQNQFRRWHRPLISALKREYEQRPARKRRERAAPAGRAKRIL
jgi:hypothetical protein